MATRNECPEKYDWWINELNSLGIKQEEKNEKLRDIQALENLTDDIKQLFIRSYKTNYTEKRNMCHYVIN